MVETAPYLQFFGTGLGGGQFALKDPDEVAAAVQFVHRGVLGYAPLVGIPEAAELHAEPRRVLVCPGAMQ